MKGSKLETFSIAKKHVVLVVTWAVEIRALHSDRLVSV
jgi:hypothetical protein